MQHEGFTLLELLITVAVIAILAAIAYPSYQHSIHKSRRADAMAALAQAQLAQEKWRASDTNYATLAELAIANNRSPYGYYRLSVQRKIEGEDEEEWEDCILDSNPPSATAYAIKATGQNGQQNDTGCTALCVNQDGIIYPARCVSR